MKQIGIFGGTFDPVHFGHIGLALSILEQGGLDEIFWIPAHLNPLKTLHPVSPKHRLEMLKLALADIPSFKILDIELNREGPSYTIDTLKLLKKEYPDAEFRLILGDDTLLYFSKWKSAEEIVKIAPPLIGTRSIENTPTSFQKVPTPFLEISATNIRTRLSGGLYCGHLVPVKVLDYIAKNGLYSLL